MWYVWITWVNNFTLQSHFIFLCPCDISFVMSQLRYQCFCYNNTFNVIFWYVQVTHKSYVIITLFLGLSLWDTLYYVTTTFSRFSENEFLITLEMRCLLLRSNYVRKSDTITLGAVSSFLGYFLVVRLHNILK